MREGEREGKVSRDPRENAEGENKGVVRKRTKERELAEVRQKKGEKGEREREREGRC